MCGYLLVKSFYIIWGSVLESEALALIDESAECTMKQTIGAFKWNQTEMWQLKQEV